MNIKIKKVELSRISLGKNFKFNRSIHERLKFLCLKIDRLAIDTLLVVQPIVVVKRNDEYQVIAGSRSFFLAKSAILDNEKIQVQVIETEESTDLLSAIDSFFQCLVFYAEIDDLKEMAAPFVASREIFKIGRDIAYQENWREIMRPPALNKNRARKATAHTDEQQQPSDNQQSEAASMEGSSSAPSATTKKRRGRKPKSSNTLTTEFPDSAESENSAPKNGDIGNGDTPEKPDATATENIADGGNDVIPTADLKESATDNQESEATTLHTSIEPPAPASTKKRRGRKSKSAVNLESAASKANAHESESNHPAPKDGEEVEVGEASVKSDVPAENIAPGGSDVISTPAKGE